MKLLGAIFGLIFGIIRIIIAIVFIVSIYLLPTGVALLKGRTNTLSIFLMNFLLGFLVIPWVIALCWAFSADPRTIFHK